MSFVMFIVVGLFVGAVLSGIAQDRFRFGVAGSAAIGLAAAITGGVLGNVIAGDPITKIGTASTGGTAIAGLVAIAATAALAHRRYIRGQEVGAQARRAPTRRRALRY